ncbi:probable methyltransferase PMT27 [Chenopodium quinoa]|uniref:probable methyltransferase PMT27 n=1 Tax=Chenopodium quinoa TaxID=63459 RepID=UPI000B76C203|nr:probable methyltransferase PMT27 [Chenopodium quinoa]
MAFGRIRNNKRPSSSSNSYLSTITTVVFIGLCVLGVWMLTSDSNLVVAPKATTHASTTVTHDESNDLTTLNKSNEKINSGTFEDNPGDLPEDALKTGESQKSQEEQKISDQSSTKDYSKESNVGVSYQHIAERKDSTQENEPKNDGTGSKAKEKEPDDESAQSLGGKDSEREKQKERQEQVSEESTLTEKQNIQQSVVLDQDSNKPKQQEQVVESKDGDQQNASDQSNEEATQKYDNQQALEDDQQQDREQQKADNQQTVENQLDQEQQKSINQQQTVEEQQQQDEKPITFSDETKSDPSKQDSSEDSDAKQEKEDTSKQDKPKDQQQENEAAKQGDPEQETEGNTQTKDSTGSTDDKSKESNSLPNSGIPKESNESKRSWSTQAAHSNDEKQRRKENVKGQVEESLYGYTWKLCNVTASYDYIPCLDNVKALQRLRSTKHFEHRERHCPEDPPTCLVPIPQGYKKPVQWPQSRDKIWFHNVPHTELAKVKGHQNWVKVSGEFLTFPGGGTQFIHGALHYIDFIEKTVPGIKWGKHTRVVLDVGCGVASFGGFLFDRDVHTMSFAPKDEHEAQVQFALERGIPAISAVMGSQRLPFPSRVFDAVHCARCRVPWHAEGGRLLLELNRVLRPGGHFIWSATPVYQKLKEDMDIWEAMSALTASMCWKLEKKEKDPINKIGAAIFRKPTNNECYDKRKENKPPMCKADDDPDAAWYVPLQACMHRVPTDESARGSKWPIRWAKRLQAPPYWLNRTQMGIYGKPAPDDFEKDYEHWQDVMNKSYLNGLGISWSNVRNVMDMRAVYGGFAAALKDLKIWVLNVVNVNSPDTLPIIFERGLFGIYHDWCESFSTYPRTYDLLHADHLFSKLKERCKLMPVMAEIDRIVRPGGKLIVRDESSAIGEVENLLKSLHWEVHLAFSKDEEGILSATKSDWRPTYDP